MIIADFQVIHNFSKIWFLEEIFLLADTSIKVILRMLFLTFNNVNIQFGEKELT